MKKISVVISIYNERQCIARCVKMLQAMDAHLQIIVVDGGSEDGSWDIIESLDIIRVRSRKGRGTQMNAGAQKASGDYLFFLHADTWLSPDAFAQIREYLSQDQNQIGTFRMGFDVDHCLLRFYAYFTRFDSLFTSFGDQGIFVKRDFFDLLGGFPDWCLFEDVHFLRMARRQTKIKTLKGPVTTSARRFLQKGLVRQQLLNGFLIFKYLWGTQPKDLYAQYYS